jgi:septum site-determining protein MinD
MNKPVIGVIITRHRGKNIDMSIANIKDMLEVPLLGIIPEHDSIKESQIMKNAVIYTHPKSIATKNYIDASRRILGEEIRFEPTQNLGMIGKLLKSIGLK